MSPSDRQQFILDRLAQCGVCTYSSLAQDLGVAEMTIRRDVDRLAKRGLVYKVLGGVQTASAPRQLYESELEQRIRRNVAEKQAIAASAFSRLQPHQTIFVDGGTTSVALAKVLASEKIELSVVTNSLFICNELARAQHISLLSLGGKFDLSSGCFVGPTTEELAGRFFVDVAFFTTKGVVPAEGTFESNIAVLRIKQLIAAQSGRRVLLVDHTKFGARSLCKVLDIQSIHEIVTDAKVSPELAAQIEEEGPKVIVAQQAVEVGGRNAT